METEARSIQHTDSDVAWRLQDLKRDLGFQVLKLFGKFSRIRDRGTRGKRSSGLGLYLAKEIVELHEGRVWAESVPEHWARFCFEIPA
jgi:signal transduction histidine kinase